MGTTIWRSAQIVSIVVQADACRLDDSFDAFEHVHYLTATKDLLLIETPGHTYHHVLFCEDR
jgi:hypothetical protein